MTSIRGLRVDVTLDVRGMPSPDAYRKAVDQLNGMEEYGVLELYLEDGEPLRAIPFGLRAEGHEILVSEPAQHGVRLLVRKRSLLV